MTPPTFAVIGAQRAGTTTLFEYLREHPEIFIPAIKELSYFVDGPRWELGPSWYEAQFAEAGSATHLGDVSPGYSMFPVGTNAAEHLAELAPNALLIYSIRHPIERMISAYWMLRSQGVEREQIDVALRRDLRYLAPSMYALQLGRYLDRFPREQILVTVFEELKSHPGPVVDEVLAFLGLEAGWRPRSLGRAHNTAGMWPREPTPAALLALRIARRQGWHRSRPRDLVRWRLTSRPLRREEEPTPETLRAVREVLVPDLEQLCRLCGWTRDPWGLLEASHREDPPPRDSME